MDYRVSDYFSRRARHTSSSTYQHDPSDQAGAPDDAIFGRLSICGAERWVHIFAGLGDVADPEAWRLHIYGERVDVLHLWPMCYLQVRRFRFWDDNWSGQDRLCEVFPPLYALSTDPGFQCSGPSTEDGLLLCLTHCLTSGWRTFSGCKSSLLTRTCRRQPRTRGCGATQPSPFGLFTKCFETRENHKIRSSSRGVVWCRSVISL